MTLVRQIIGVLSLTNLFTSVPVPGSAGFASAAALLALAWSLCLARFANSSRALWAAASCRVWASEGPGVDVGR